MFKSFLDRLKFRLLAGLLLVICCFGLVQPVQAGKAPKALIFNGPGSTGADNSVEVVTLYETSYAAQKSVVKSLKVPTKSMKKASGFQGASMLRSQNGKQVLTFSQWQDLASYQAYQPPAGANAGSALPPPPEPTHNARFEVAMAQTSIPGAVPALRGKEAVVQWVQFTPKDDEARSPLLSQLADLIPSLLTQQPIPQSILLLKGTDSNAIALMMNWNCSALFEDVGQPGAIAISPSLMALAESTQQLYDVANIIPAEQQKPEADNSY